MTANSARAGAAAHIAPFYFAGSRWRVDLTAATTPIPSITSAATTIHCVGRLRSAAA